ncbi:hypothetical protein, partial [Brevundimonas sp.]|uniref:hypothetical protein n=1 Tax=Brevundimonas sp. TaxID=1871086 RepID=UPI0037830F8B
GDTINGLTLERFRKRPALNTHQTLLSSSEKLAWVSTETREDQSWNDHGAVINQWSHDRIIETDDQVGRHDNHIGCEPARLR